MRRFAFVRNTEPTELKATLSFRVHGREPELWNVDDAAKVPALAYKETDGGRTEIPLTFPAKGSVFVIFERPTQRHLVEIEKEGSTVFPSIHQGVGVFSIGEGEFVATVPGTYRATDSEGTTQTFAVSATEPHAPINTSWTLSFPAGWGAPSSVPVDRFRSWTESTDPGIRYFSGTAVYRTNLQIPADFVTPGRQLWLQLGQVREIATVTVNGRAADTVWRQPFGVRIDPLVHAGNNIVEIKVTNLWPNRIIGDLQPSATARYTQSNVRRLHKDSPLMPSWPSRTCNPTNRRRAAIEVMCCGHDGLTIRMRRKTNERSTDKDPHDIQSQCYPIYSVMRRRESNYG